MQPRGGGTDSESPPFLSIALDFFAITSYSLVDGSVSPALTTPSLSPASLGGAFDLYRQAAPEEFFQELEKELNLPVRQRLFSLSLVMWMMIWQRLSPKATMSAAVQEVVELRPRALMPDYKRVQEKTVGSGTGAYSDARQAIPIEAAERVADRVYRQLAPSHREALPGWKRPVLILDGSTLEMPHTKELVQAYPPATNQHGVSHWPVMRFLVAHELTTGVAVRPCWGPMYGPEAVSEQSLTELLLDHLPELSVLMGDINFGVFSVAYAGRKRGHDLLLRLLPVRAGVVGGRLPLSLGTDRQVCWQPSAYDRKRHPELPADACVQGRLMVQEVTTSAGTRVTLYVFTTLSLGVEQILQLYGQRWSIETDLRSLKQTVKLQVLRCQSVKMIAKELILGIVGYNLVRAVMNAAAEQHQIDPRRLSFSRSQDVVNAAMPGLEAAATEAEYQIRLCRMLQRVASCKLPDRSKRASAPRQIWGRSHKFAKRKIDAPNKS